MEAVCFWTGLVVLVTGGLALASLFVTLFCDYIYRSAKHAYMFAVFLLHRKEIIEWERQTNLTGRHKEPTP